MLNKLITILYIGTSISLYAATQGISNAMGGYVGDNIASFCLAKILSLKYNIPYYLRTFEHSDIFVLHDREKHVNDTQYSNVVNVFNENDIKKHSDKDHTLFQTNILTRIYTIEPSWINLIKELVQLKDIDKLKSIVNAIPEDRISIAVHIRKGNGGGQYYDGEQTSLQQFNFDRSCVTYLDNYDNYAFDWDTYTRSRHKLRAIQGAKNSPIIKARSPREIDKVGDWQTKFPPDQYYIDQIIKVADSLPSTPLFVQIFTDDKNPYALVERIRKAVTRPNIIFHYENNREYSHRDRIAQDLYSISRFDVLIRSQSYFARAAELIGNHKLVIFPLRFKWEGNKLIMTHIVLRGSLSQLYT